MLLLGTPLSPKLSSRSPVLEEALNNARREFESSQAGQCRAREAGLGIGRKYHPFDLKTSAPKEASEAQAGLSTHFDTLEQNASERHQGLREISPRMLRVLGVLHNFVIKRSDGSTAANRFFGQKHQELFPWLNRISKRAESSLNSQAPTN